MTESPRTRVLVVMGGQSSEHQISCATAAGILRALDRQTWDVVPVGITEDGQWVPVADDPQSLDFVDGKGQSIVAGDTRVALVPGSRRLVSITGSGTHAQVQDLGEVDVALPLLHGPYGEDGTIQGLFEMSGLPYVGCGVTSSAVSMDKHLTKVVLTAAGINAGHWELVTAKQWDADQAECAARVDALGYPVFVKPCRAGSSIGISKVDRAEDLAAAIDEARAHDPRIIVEAATPGREIECGVLAQADGSVNASLLGEIVVPEGQFYDFELKYFDTAGVGLLCPADIDAQVADEIRDVAIRAFEALECEGLARVDFFYDAATASIIVNEVNTMPGFTPYSMYPQVWAAGGMDYSDLLDRLLREALARPAGLR